MVELMLCLMRYENFIQKLLCMENKFICLENLKVSSHTAHISICKSGDSESRSGFRFFIKF